jgi:hypothetical protein
LSRITPIFANDTKSTVDQHVHQLALPANHPEIIHQNGFMTAPPTQIKLNTITTVIGISVQNVMHQENGSALTRLRPMTTLFSFPEEVQEVILTVHPHAAPDRQRGIQALLQTAILDVSIADLGPGRQAGIHIRLRLHPLPEK